MRFPRGGVAAPKDVADELGSLSASTAAFCETGQGVRAGCRDMGRAVGVSLQRRTVGAERGGDRER